LLQQSSPAIPVDGPHIDRAPEPSVDEDRFRMNRFVDDAAAVDDDDDDISVSAEMPSTFDPLSNDVKKGSVHENDYESDYDGEIHSLSRKKVVQLPESQPPFAVSATPLHLDRRFLCWNHIGSITSHEVDGRCNIDIDFTDSAFRRPISFTDTMGFILGSLGEQGGIFASDLCDDADANEDHDDEVDDVVNRLSEKTRNAVARSRLSRKKQESHGNPLGSNIFFFRFETFASVREKDWCITLPTGERVLGCACGDGWAAVVSRLVINRCRCSKLENGASLT
jgi:hypothetical protein